MIKKIDVYICVGNKIKQFLLAPTASNDLKQAQIILIAILNVYSILNGKVGNIFTNHNAYNCLKQKINL